MTDREQMKPVAWMYELKGTVLFDYSQTPNNAKLGFTETQLYTAGQLAAARIEGAKAMQEAAVRKMTAWFPAQTARTYPAGGVIRDVRALDPATIIKEAFDD